MLHTGTTYTTPALTSAATYYTELTEGTKAPEISVAKDNITINVMPSITGTPKGYIGATTQLTAPAGGTWTSSNTSVATVSSTGLVTSFGRTYNNN